MGVAALIGATPTASCYRYVTTPIALPKIAFTSAAQSVSAGVVSGTMTVQLEDTSGTPTNAGTGATTTRAKLLPLPSRRRQR